MQNKPIIILKSKYLGNTIKGKIDNIIKELNYPVINIDQSKKIDFRKILNKKNVKKIELYKNKKLFIVKKKTDVQQVIDFLKKDIKTHSYSKNF
jgi:molybdopterin-binding protein